MNLVKIIVRLYCFFKGYKVRSLTKMSEFEEAFHLRNRVYSEVYGFTPVPTNQETIAPKGIACYIGIYKKKQLIGCVRLMDLTEITPFVTTFYKDPVLDRPNKKTYEMTGLVVEPKLQGSDSHIFLILMYYAYLFTIKMKRTYWLASTWKSLYHHINRMGGNTQFITDVPGFKDDGSPRAEFLKNYLTNGNADDYCCYYVTFPENYDKMMLKNFIRKMKRKLVKKWKRKFQKQTK